MSIPVPVVNLGERQRGREAGACMLQAGHQRGEIAAAIEAALHDEGYRARLEAFSSRLIHRETTALVVEEVRRADPARGAAPKKFYLLANDPA